jgi:hypothetical protein
LKKIICIFILTSQISWAQEIRVIDNKGTINNFRNNQLTNSVIEPANPLENDVWFNNLITKIWDGTAWKSMLSESKSKTLILNKEDGTPVTGADRVTPLDLPLTVLDTLTINSTYYTVTNILGPGVGVQIEILKAGNYLISAELSVDNMPPGDTEYELAILINGDIAGYLSQGYASIPIPIPIPLIPIPNIYEIGITGALMYVLAAEDRINIKYILDTNVNNLEAPFLKIGITKL